MSLTVKGYIKPNSSSFAFPPTAHILTATTMADAPPDDLNATILARIDRLTLDLVRQLVEHSDLLHSPTTATSPTVAASTASPSATSLPGDEAGQRPKKRQKATLPAATPLSLLRFDGDAGTAGVRSGVCFPTNSERGVRRFGE